MSSLTLNDVLNRSLLDGEFRRAVQADPDTALDGLDLTGEERAALLSRSNSAATALAAAPAEGTYVYNVYPPLTPPPTVQVVSPNFPTITITTGQGSVGRVAPEDLAKRGDAIVRMAGDRFQPIKDLLTLMR